MVELDDTAVRVDTADGLLLRPTSRVRELKPGDVVRYAGQRYRIVAGCPEGVHDCRYVHADLTPPTLALRSPAMADAERPTVDDLERAADEALDLVALRWGGNEATYQERVGRMGQRLFEGSEQGLEELVRRTVAMIDGLALVAAGALDCWLGDLEAKDRDDAVHQLRAGIRWHLDERRAAEEQA